jgi:hypothetical protein
VTYHRNNLRHRIPGGFFHFEEAGTKARVCGFGHGDYIRLRDENGNTWRGSAEQGADQTVRYRFQSETGHTITGISDSWGLILRDQKGRTWRGFVE